MEKENLLTAELLKIIPPLYYHEDSKEEMVFYAKLYAPENNWTWYIAELDKKDLIAFGYVVGFESEYGEFSLREISELQVEIKRDASFKPTKASKLMDNINKNKV